jgi:hypothetical protein
MTRLLSYFLTLILKVKDPFDLTFIKNNFIMYCFYLLKKLNRSFFIKISNFKLV